MILNAEDLTSNFKKSAFILLPGDDIYHRKEVVVS
jgi:hypothetical protein